MAVPLPATRQVATSDSPVVVERTLTFSNQGYGLTMSAGSNTPATRWIFAEDTTANHFQTFLTILNPNTVPTQVTACFYGQGGDSPGNRTPVAPGLSRANLKFNDFLSASGIASVVTGNLPVAVERSHRPCASISMSIRSSRASTPHTVRSCSPSAGFGFVAEQTVFAPNYSSLRSTPGLAQ